MMTSSRCTALLYHLVALGFAAGCEQKPPPRAPAAPPAASQPTAALPADLFVTQAPAGARRIADIKADPNAAGEVVVHGRIGGRKAPFITGTAVFLLADASLKPCNMLHGDSCPTPWDYCCEPRDLLTADTATIQIVGADGKPLRTELAGQHGLAPLAEVTIAGEIAQRDASGSLVITARRIHVAR